MKKRFVIFFLFTILLFSVSFVSANIFSDIWKKITGKTIIDSSSRITDSSFVQNPENVLTSGDDYSILQYATQITCPYGFVPYSPYPNFFCQHPETNQILGGWEIINFQNILYNSNTIKVTASELNLGCSNCAFSSGYRVFYSSSDYNSQISWIYAGSCALNDNANKVDCSINIPSTNIKNILLSRDSGGDFRPDPAIHSIYILQEQTTPTPTCTDECSSGQLTCSGNYAKTCGNYDSDSCLEYNSGNYCAYGCVNGICSSAPANTTNQTNQTTIPFCGNGIKEGTELCDYAATDSVNNPYGSQCSNICWVNGAPPYWLGCRGSGAHVCTDNPKVTDQYFIDNPNCIKNPTCAGTFYNCNGVICPPPTSTTATGTCTDSDGGVDYSIKGTVKGVYTTNQGTNSYEWPDYCMYNILNEFSCGYGASGGLAQGSQAWTDLYTCPNGCKEGVCLDVSETQSDTSGAPSSTEDQTGESEQNQPPEDNSYQQENPEFGFIDQTFSLIIDFVKSIFGDTKPPIATITTPTANQFLVVGTTSTTLSVTTNEVATCRYSTTDQLYSSMPDTNTMTGAGTSGHSATISGLANGGSYTRYVRCQDTAGNTMTSSVNISFNVANPSVFCGNGILETGESCDDGNTISGDGCSNVCQKEEITEQQGWIFTNQYSACGSIIAVTTNGDMGSIKNIMDGSLLTSWIRGRDGNDYIKFDFGCRLLIQNVRIRMYGSPVTLNSDPECEIYVSEDNSNYRHLMNVDVQTETGCPECGNDGFKIDINEEGRFLKYYCPTRLETNAYYEEIYFQTTTNTALIPPQITINEIVPDYLLTTDIFNPKFTITDIDGVDKNSVILKIVDASGNVARQAQLFDDGFHSDLGGNDNIYGELIDLNGLVDGTYKINIVASDTKGNVKNSNVYKIEILESLDHCLDTIPNQNNRNDLNRINVIFTMIGGDRDVGIYKENAAKVINEGFKSLQPFESEIDKFNFFFVDTIGDIPSDSTSADPNNPNSMTSKINEMASKCPYGNVKYTMNFIAKENRIGASGRHIFMYDINILNRILNSEQISAFMHEFGHSFGNLGDEYLDINPPSPWNVSNPSPMPNCFAASSVDDCLDNAPWNYLVGKGCGDPNKIDCTPNNDKYDLEVGCFDMCGSASGLYRSINNGLMRGYNKDYGLWNEKLICDQIKKSVGNVGEYCQLLDNNTGLPTIVCGNGIIEGTEECDGINLNEKTCTSFEYAGGTLTCTSGCLLNKTLCTTNPPVFCGNGILEIGESCDDGNTISGDGCSNICQKERTSWPKKIRDILKRLF